MAAETQTLNFGPEWLRALSSGGSVMSPPLSPALPKYKLADYRYGREEMLALYVKNNKIPTELQDKEFECILEEEPLPPLALVPFTEEEQRNFSISVNSMAVLRLAGRGGGTVAGAVRGRSSSSRGRGRGRGEGGFYQRSFDEVDGGFGRGVREMHRSQSWEERGDRRFDKARSKEPARVSFEDGATVAGKKHEFTRSESENWRMTREEQNGEEDDAGWRIAGARREGDKWRPNSPDGPRSAGWRENPDRRKRFDFEFRERDEERGYRRPCSGSLDDEKEVMLPEWCLEDPEGELGTFDSSGAFHSLKKSTKESIPEEQEVEFRAVEESGEPSESENCHRSECKDLHHKVMTESDIREPAAECDEPMVLKEKGPVSESMSAPMEPPLAETEPAPLPVRKKKEEVKTLPEPVEKTKPIESKPERCKPPPAQTKLEVTVETQPLPQKTAGAAVSSEGSIHPPTVTKLVPLENRSTFTDNDDEEGLKRLEREMNQEAEKMVAYLQDNALDDEKLLRKIQEHKGKGSMVLQPPEALQMWFYKDPQGEIQGPFSNKEMAEWFKAGYFSMSLLVKRVGDERFQTLGDVIEIWGRVPFVPASGPLPPPMLGDVDQEQLKRQQELATLYQMQQLQYQQFLLRQQYTQLLAQQQKASLPSGQQQQQLTLLLQQFQALKSRSSEQNLIPPVTRSMSVSDTGSIWEVQTTPSQPAGWEGSSVWDLPVEAASTSQTLEHIQQLEKAKTAKLEQERREAELRAKREEEERKRQEELRRRHQQQLQEEERKRREEEELARRKQEEALRRQRDQELALKRQREQEELVLRLQREQEERQKQEEALRCLEERRREEEERRQREERLRKQEEEALKWAQEEEEAYRRQQEETAAKLRQEEEEERKRMELERQKELQRQRQQQQEALRRLQQQQQQHMAQMKLPSSSTWGQQMVTSASQAQSALSLAEIQKLEEEGERQRQEEQRRHQKELMKVVQQQHQQQKLPGWAHVPKQSTGTKSLVEIQQEEARQMQKQQQQPPNRTHSNLLSSPGNPVWHSVNTSPTNQWSSDMSSIWGTCDTKNANMGFWDDAVKEVGPRNSTAKNNKSNANLGKMQSLTSKQNKKAEEEEEKLMRLFQGVTKSQDGFTQWCEQMLRVFNTTNNLDVPTFVAFLKEVESPYEVHDYIRNYLGDTPETKEFAKVFLERRAKQKANQLQQHQDLMWRVNQRPLQTVPQFNHSNNQQHPSTEALQTGKKKKKQKMVKADPSILGFSVNASSERLNMGEIEMLED